MFKQYINNIKINIAVLLSFCTCLLSSCSFTNPVDLTPVSKNGFYFDTIITVTLYGTNKEKYLDECLKIAEKYEKLLSASRADSEVSEINSKIGENVEVSADTSDVIEKALEYAKLSEGLFDPTVGELTGLWDFHGDEISDQVEADSENKTSAASQGSRIPDKNAIATAIKTINYNNIIITSDSKSNSVMLKEGKLDLGGIAKGYIADKMRDYLLSEGIDSGIINLGGNLLLLGPKADGSPYTVGIQKPFSESGESAFTLSLTDKSIVTSGTYERCFEEDGQLYHHILDPHTGYPADKGISSVTVITDSSTDADALSTTLFLMGKDKALEYAASHEDVDVVIITDEGDILPSDGALDLGFKKL